MSCADDTLFTSLPVAAGMTGEAVRDLTSLHIAEERGELTGRQKDPDYQTAAFPIVLAEKTE